MDFSFSRYGRESVKPSPVNEMMASFASDFRDGVDINLGVGYVNEKTIPTALLSEVMGEIAANPEIFRQAFNYGGPQGAPGLIQALRDYHVSEGIGGMTEEVMARLELVIGPSGATSILDALADIMEPGIVITADPLYYIYCDHLERKGFDVIAVPEEAGGLNPAAVRNILDQLGPLSERLSFFYVVTVNNPSGTVLCNEYRFGLAELAAEWSARLGRCCPIFFDQAYEWLIHDPDAEVPRSALVEVPEAPVYEIGTLSKVLAPALRIGFMVGQAGALMQALVQKTSDVGFSAPLLNQEMAAVMLRRHMRDQVMRVKEGYREKSLVVGQAIHEILGPWLEEVRGGTAGFYYYLTFQETATHSASLFFNFLSRTTGDPLVDGESGALHPRVIYIPGEFCVHPLGFTKEKGQRQLRLSYGYEETENIVAALGWMKEALRYAEGQR
ncbi:MAG: aminotransferase class I/II-fold pyridoxal phosphate-dependent enzyme [Candidatus Hydrogenedens sp.]|jgi:DNA-binding transcriptional MocR family regulator|nr:aminotransferase class I/II-fold pyridoxal phosphate-dependent enzyme [Candidatus Hydrogenedens sp.]